MRFFLCAQAAWLKADYIYSLPNLKATFQPPRFFFYALKRVQKTFPNFHKKVLAYLTEL